MRLGGKPVLIDEQAEAAAHCRREVQNLLDLAANGSVMDDKDPDEVRLERVASGEIRNYVADSPRLISWQR